MLVVLAANHEELHREAGRIVGNAVRQNPAIRLGLATGNTMIGLYRELARLHREDSLDFSRVVTFNLDEYLGISPTHPSQLSPLHAGKLFFAREH
jgi:6-phosphogluconolactonase/Glucosamine-6-phosphate isomerase/deaminase